MEDVPHQQGRSETQSWAPEVEEHDTGATGDLGPCQEEAGNKCEAAVVENAGTVGDKVVEYPGQEAAEEHETHHPESNDTGQLKWVGRQIILCHSKAQLLGEMDDGVAVE